MSKVVNAEWRTGIDTVGIILTYNEYDGYKAYIGCARFDDTKLDINHIKGHGAKLTYEEAAPFFPAELMSSHLENKTKNKYDGMEV